MIDPRLKSLAAVRDTGTVTAAAALLHVTPSTISDPGTAPPTSVWCAILTVYPARRPQAKMGWSRKQSG